MGVCPVVCALARGTCLLSLRGDHSDLRNKRKGKKADKGTEGNYFLLSTLGILTKEVPIDLWDSPTQASPYQVMDTPKAPSARHIPSLTLSPPFIFFLCQISFFKHVLQNLANFGFSAKRNQKLVLQCHLLENKKIPNYQPLDLL